MKFSVIERNMQFCFEKESKKEFQNKPNEQKSSKGGVVAVNDAELLARNNENKIRSGVGDIRRE